MNDQPPIVYKVVSFSKRYVEKRMKQHSLEKESKNWTKEQHREWRKQKLSEPYIPDLDLWENGNMRGLFTDLQPFLDALLKESDPYGICECYYEYIVIEPYRLNEIDSCFVEDEKGEWIRAVWYKMDDNYKWSKIETPECFKQVIGF